MPVPALGGNNIPIVVGDLLVSNGASGQIEHMKPDGTHVQMIITRGYYNVNGTTREVEAGDVCFDNSGNFYVCIEGLNDIPNQWGGPQVQKFDNSGNDLGRWDTCFSQDRNPEGIIQLLDNSFVVVLLNGLNGTPKFLLWHLDTNGNLLADLGAQFETVDNTFFSRIDVGCDGTVFYNSGQRSHVIYRYDIVNNQQLANFVELPGVGHDIFNAQPGDEFLYEDLLCLPDGGLIFVKFTASTTISTIVRVDSSGTQVWAVDTNSNFNPGRARAALSLDLDGTTFLATDFNSSYTDEERVARYRVDTGAYVGSMVRQAIPYVDYLLSITTYLPIVTRCPVAAAPGMLMNVTVIGAN